MAAGVNAVAPADRVLIIERVLDAPRSLVFKAWTDSQHLAHWFGPKGFNLIFCEMDLRVGGIYRFGMRSPEGTNHYLKGVYKEIREPEVLVCTYAWTDADGNPTRPETTLSLSFDDIGGNKTRLTLHQALFESITACDAHRGGWNSSLDRLAEFVASA